MPLNKSKGNMYSFITHTWNTIKGECSHDCSYCYMKRWGKLNPVRFDEKELKTDLGKGNFIFVGSSCDMFANDIPDEWIEETLKRCNTFDNSYFFQTKDPLGLYQALHLYRFPNETSFCTTIETNRYYKDVMNNSPLPKNRAFLMNDIAHDFKQYEVYVTIEPILDFDLDEMSYFIETCLPKQVNIGADSSGNNLPEPPKEKVLELISELEKFTIVNQKLNLKRLLK